MISKPKFESSAKRRRIRGNFYNRSPAKRHDRSMNRFRRWARLACGILLVSAISAVFILAYDMVTQWDFFNTKYIYISGNRHLDRTRIMDRAEVKMDRNLLTINTAAAAKRLKSHPWIADAEVWREIPSWIHIRVREHEPLAIIDLGRRFLLNTNGRIFKELAASDPANLPVIGGLGYADIPVDETPGTRRFDAVMQVLRLGGKPASVLPNHMLRQIDVDREMGLTVYALGDVTGRIQVIKIGFDDYPDKYERLKAIFSRVKRAEIEVIDVNDWNRIIVDPADAMTSTENKKEV